jgi:hypothetical protein
MALAIEDLFQPSSIFSMMRKADGKDINSTAQQQHDLSRRFWGKEFFKAEHQLF